MNYKTPLRYPGGKQRLSPFIEDILVANNIVNGHYIEPYAGGAGVAIELLLSGKVAHIHLNDANKGIYAFWFSILNYTQEFCELIAKASLTIEEWKLQKEKIKNPNHVDLLSLGFATFYLNRCNRSGILSAGVIGGYHQSGKWKMSARFSRNDLIRRIETIALFRECITITNMDAECYITNYIPNLPYNSLIYLDPPYYEKAAGLYLNSYLKKDHVRIADIIQNQINHQWVLSYDSACQILDLYLNRKSFLYDLQYNAGRVYKGKEVFIFSDDVLIPASSSLKNIQVALEQLEY